MSMRDDDGNPWETSMKSGNGAFVAVKSECETSWGRVSVAFVGFRVVLRMLAEISS